MSINLAGLAALIFALLWLRQADSISSLQANLIVLCAYAVPIIALELLILKTFRRHSTGLDFSRPSACNLRRAVTRLLGFYATIGLVIIFYLVFPVYEIAGDSLYSPYLYMVKLALPWISVAAVPYFFILDRYMREPLDAYWQTGMMLMGRISEVNSQEVIQHFLGWLIKAFFLALMYAYMSNDIIYFRNVDFDTAFLNFQNSYEFLFRSLFMIDVTLSAVGYILTVRILDSHIRSTESTLLGWTSAVICYAPFWSLLSREYFDYEGGYTWGAWLADHPWLYIAWGSTILVLVFIYVLSTIPFGIRFSNLTHRGIITNGPYQFCKHPAYVSKNLSWWLISIPFIPNSGFLDAAQHCLLLLAINIIYFIRARTEERHLSRDPVYVQYATEMNRRSIFRWLAIPFPFLKYKPDAVPVSRTMPNVNYN